MQKSTEIKLQVQIAAYGIDGMERVVKHRHPAVNGVKWLVSWQLPKNSDAKIPDYIRNREDFDVIIHYGKGVSKNRNVALEYESDSSYVLLSDDDVDYTAEALLKVIEAFETHPDADLLCFRYSCNGKFVKKYGEKKFKLSRPPRGWYPTTFEMAFRRKSRGSVLFNENVGPGSERYIAGEDTVWFFDMLKQACDGYFIPLTICSHNQSTTGTRMAYNPEFMKAHGAILRHIKPRSWFIRTILYSLRSKKPLQAFRYALKGALGKKI